MASVVEFGWRRTAVVAAVMLAALMQLADTTIVNVALPTIDGSLGASVDEGAWFVTAYIIANVIVIPLSPWLMIVVGRRNYFALSIAGFTAASILCGLADSTNAEIALRFVQGAFGGGLMVPAQQIMRDTFPPAELGKSQSLFALAVVIGPTIGPTVGGILTDNASWNWVFFVNVIPGIVATALVLLFLRDPAAPKRVPFDGWGVALMAVGLGSLQYVLDEGERSDWFNDNAIVLLTVLAATALTGFVLWELFVAKTPAVALRVLRNRTVWAMALFSFATGATLFGLIFIQPQYTQNVLGFTTTLAGTLLMVRAGAMALLYPVTNWVVNQRYDLRFVAAGGILLLGAATWWQAGLMTSHSTFGTFVVSQALGGVGLAFVFVPLNVLLFRAVEPPTVPAALALSRLAQQIGGSFGSAYAVTLLDRGFAHAYATLAAGLTANRPPVSLFLASHAHGAVALAGIVAREASNLSNADATRFFALLSFGVVAVPFLFARGTLPAARAAAPQPPDALRPPATAVSVPAPEPVRVRQRELVAR
ncbi:MAG: DHA2 family efflux MFS transporter permease subunit [Vulcanimicrobiaceae bacterium]